MAIGCADQRNSLNLYSVAQVRAIEAAALSLVGPGILMQRAGAAVARHALTLLPEINKDLHVLVAAGPGNNGGDALEAAAILAQQGITVTIVHLADENMLPPDARMALTRARQNGAVFVESLAGMSWSLAIDGLFGIGLTRPLEDRYRALATQLNRLSCPVLAIDVPSGLDADTGGVVGSDGLAVQSDRLGSANALAHRYHATVILKGSGSIIAHPGDIPVINTTGNPALATAGSGDVLAGLCGALLAQGWTVRACALAATWLHGSAADQMVADGAGPIGATASELIPWIRRTLNKFVSETSVMPR